MLEAKKLVTKELTKRFVKLSLYQLLMISHLAQDFKRTSIKEDVGRCEHRKKLAHICTALLLNFSRTSHLDVVNQRTRNERMKKKEQHETLILPPKPSATSTGATLRRRQETHAARKPSRKHLHEHRVTLFAPATFRLWLIPPLAHRLARAWLA